MALTNIPSAPTLSGVYSVKDFVPQLNQATDSTTKALQNAFNFGTKVHDYMKSRKQADLMKRDTEEYQSLQKSIEEDQALLEDLKSELASLEGGE